jgi:hypothetical protein
MKLIMRLALGLAVVAGLAWLAAPAHAVQATHHNPARVTAHRCTPGIDWNWHRSDHPEWTQADIDAQCMPNWAVESRAICTDVQHGGTYTRYSGIVTNEGTEARATCNLNLVIDNLQYCAYRLRNGSGTWSSWHTVCTPITGRRGS